MRRLLALVIIGALVAACGNESAAPLGEATGDSNGPLSGPVQIDRELFGLHYVFGELPGACSEALPDVAMQEAVDAMAADGSPTCITMGGAIADATHIETAEIQPTSAPDRFDVVLQLNAPASQGIDEPLFPAPGDGLVLVYRDRLVSRMPVPSEPLRGRIVLAGLTEVEANDLVDAVRDATAPQPTAGESKAAFAPGDPAGPGTPLFAGLVVPEGTERIFAAPADYGTLDRWDRTANAAVLQIIGDLLDVWADLVEQVAALGGTLPGSGVCWWNPNDGYPSSLLEPRPKGGTTVECSGGTAFDRAGQTVLISISARVEQDGAEMMIYASRGAGQEGPFPDDPGPVPSADLRGLPEDATPDAPGEGDEFGESHNCFESGYDRFRMPEGARYVGGGRTTMTAPVLEVDDPEAVLEALRDQLDEPDDTSGDWSITNETVDGEAVWRMHGGVSAGGGACNLYTIDDGRYLVVTTWSD